MKKSLKWVKRIVKGLLLLIVVLLIVGVVYEQFARSTSNKKYQPTGEFVDIEDHKLHYFKKGNSGPTVIFESGLDAAGHLPWFKVQNEVAKFAVTLSYDRAGIMWSERGKNPKSIKAMGEDLKAVLEEADLQKPYILVGHSLAGLTMRQYIIDNPNDIAGIVLVDASNPDLIDRASDKLKETIPTPPPSWLVKLMSMTGVYRFMFKPSYTSNEDDAINVLARNFLYKGLNSYFEETQNIEAMIEEAQAISSFGNIPLRVISAGHESRYDYVPDKELNEEMLTLGMQLQKELLNLSTNSEHILAEESGHYVQLDQPELVVDIIKKMITESKNDLDN